MKRESKPAAYRRFALNVYQHRQAQMTHAYAFWIVCCSRRQREQAPHNLSSLA